ncbi:MAG: RNA polymerase sigma factor [Lewinellaceae bacterium]|nr:RNA polymerase sigma factor [Saprospiraceae bacterium]MCB9340292.1 RNA polymerase sigma factor [Lewinellaceae bacterium]
MTTHIGMTETELVQSCLKNDRVAQKDLYDKYKKAMYTLAYRITGDFESANDVLQDAFVKVFRGLPSFRGESTLGAWIKTIVIRTAYSYLRKDKIFFEDIENVNPKNHLDWGHYLDAEYLEKAILSLPEGYRTVFVLIEVEGYGHKEVAEMLGISEGTSKSQLFYSKKRLREMLKKNGY